MKRSGAGGNWTALVLGAGALALLLGCRGGRLEDTAGPGEIESQASALGEAFTAVDIGTTGATGSYSQAGGVHTVKGAGADIWSTADAFRFVYVTLPGDGTITARVASLQNTDPFAKAGVMMRESLAANAKNVMLLVTPTLANGFRFQNRISAGGTTNKTVGAQTVPPAWVRLTRTGSSFSAASSPDGNTWTAITPAVTISMTSTIFVGLAVTSHVAGTLATATFDNLTIAPPGPPPAPSGLVANPGNAQVNLAWSATAGAASYTVKSSTTNGGPYTVVQPGLTTPSFNHGGLNNGTTYYYVVSASNAAGEGPNSAQAQATPSLPAPPGAPSGLVATAGNAQVSLTWGSVSGATSYTVKSASSASGPFNPVQPGVTATNFTHNGLNNGTTYFYVVSASNAGGEGPDSNVAQATPSAPPPPTFATQDIGNIGSAPGSWSESGGTHTVKGSGGDIYGTADAFRFAYQTISGDVTITARVQSLTAPNVWTKAVVMIREDLTAGAKNVATLLSPTAANKYRQQVRTGAGGSTTSTPSTADSTLPSHIRLERIGSTFRSYHSPNGSTWTLIGSATVAMNASVRVGIGVTSHTANTLATGVFTNVVITTPAPPAAPADLTAAGQNKQVYLSWSPVTGATSYTVKRSDTSGGPYATVQSNIAVTQFTNTGLVNGNTYHFVVSASNAAGSSGDSPQATASPQLLQPSVRSVSPVNGQTNVPPDEFVSTDLIMPNVGGGVDSATLTSASVFLKKHSDGTLVSAQLNTSGGGDVVVLQPLVNLEPQTLYDFSITSGLQDLTGAPFIPFTSSFTTGDALPPPDETIAFDQVALPSTAGPSWTSITIGPDNKLYAASVTGDLKRWTMNADGTLGAATVINTITNNNGGARAIVGLTFDPAATASNLILWVTHGGSALKEAPDWSGKLSKLTGASLGTYQDVVINFPRSFKDHMTNSIAFKAGLPNIVWIAQGSMNAMGAPDNAWGQRAEHLMSAAILRLDTTKLGTLPLDIKTNDADPTASGYNPFAANAPLTIYASGVRNAYDLIWHSNGELYTAVNGSAAGGSTPATPGSLPSACQRRIDGTPYTGPAVPAIATNPIAEDDFLYRVLPSGYYGHPNPSRCEWVLNGGNPTSGADKSEVVDYPSGTLPDRNWKKDEIFSFGAHHSPDGTIEWTSNTVFPSMKGKLLVARFSGGKDIIVVSLDPATKHVVTSPPPVTGLTGMTGFADPLDLVANPSTGHIYVTEHAGNKIALLRPRP